MRILILNQYALPAGAAGITRHGDLGAALVKRGHEVTVIASDFDYLSRTPTHHGATGATTVHSGVTFLWLQTGAYVANDGKRTRSMLRYAIRATRASLSLRPPPDVIIGSSPQLLAPLAASVAARLRRVPWIFEARDIWPSALVDLGAITRGGVTHRSLERLERYLYNYADAVVTVPPRGNRRLEELGIDTAKWMHIPNGASAELSPPDRLPPDIERVLADSQFAIVYTGAIGATHDFGAILTAIQGIKEDAPRLYEQLALLIVGGGVAATDTRQRAIDAGLDRVHIFRAVEKPTIRALLERADACLLALANADVLRYGISPNKLFDYLAAAKPVLVSSFEPTFVDEAGAGIRYLPGDSSSIADGIEKLMTIPEMERARMGERGRDLVRAKYSIDAIADQYESLLKRVVAGHR